MAEYPGEGQIAVWIDDYFSSVEHRGMRYEAFLAMKACDWQRERDALICEQLINHEHEGGDCDLCDEVRNLASDIRNPPTPPLTTEQQE